MGVKDAAASLKEVDDYKVDLENRIIYLMGSVNESMVAKFLPAFKALEHSTSPVTIIMHSNGGDPEDGFAIYNIIKDSHLKVKGIVLGKCHSMMSLILQACKTREMYNSAWMLVHPGTFRAAGHSPNVISAVKSEIATLERMHSIYYEKYYKSRSKKDQEWSEKKFKEYFNQDRYLTALDALRFGFIDKILGD